MGCFPRIKRGFVRLAGPNFPFTILGWSKKILIKNERRVQVGKGKKGGKEWEKAKGGKEEEKEEEEEEEG